MKRWIGFALVVVIAAGVAAYALFNQGPQRSEFCVAEVGQIRARVDPEQARWSALMAAKARARDLPARATTIAIATAFQESKIHNIDYGDRDSLGLFQQRPSQGWGTPGQIMDPAYSIDAFYDRLIRVPNYANIDITDAAQAVQRSAFPDAYSDHVPYARALASALRGASLAAFTCQINPTEGVGSLSALRADLSKAFGRIDLEVDKTSISARIDGKPRPGDGWALAHYLVANAQRLHIAEVRVGAMTWNARESAYGWQRSHEDQQNQRVIVTLMQAGAERSAMGHS